MIANILAVVASVAILLDVPDAKKGALKFAKKATALACEIYAMAKSTRQAVAQRGDQSVTVKEALCRKPPLALKQMLAKRVKLAPPTKNFRRWGKALPDDTPQRQVEYMRRHLARRRASILAGDFLLQTHEGVQTIHSLVFGHRVDYIGDDTYEMLCMPLG